MLEQICPEIKVSTTTTV